MRTVHAVLYQAVVARQGTPLQVTYNSVENGGSPIWDRGENALMKEIMMLMNVSDEKQATMAILTSWTMVIGGGTMGTMALLAKLRHLCSMIHGTMPMKDKRVTVF